jgi:nitrite reductase/ring-hydroxylating ferredoxin subunit
MGIIPDGSIRSFRLDDREIMVINSNGRLFCLQGRCTHAGAPLSEGTIEDDILTCPWHGSKFRITNGEVIRGPAAKPLQVYKNTIKDNSLYIEI